MMRKLNLLIKRFFDIIVSSIGIIICALFWLVIVILIKILMPGPVFFKQDRVGKKFKVFSVLKFRTMRVDQDAEKNSKIEKDKERITFLGNILRRTKLDETPQLINVLKGDMSLVGPRPTVQQRVDEYPEYQRKRLSMRPGMTGLAQTRGNVLLSWPRRIQYDCEYVERFTVFLDLQILINTVGVILLGEEKYISEKDLSSYKNPVYDNVRK